MPVFIKKIQSRQRKSSVLWHKSTFVIAAFMAPTLAYGISFKESLCSKALVPEYFPAYHGKQVSLDFFEGDGEHLGSGIGGGNVYRISLEDGANSRVGQIIEEPTANIVIVKKYFKAVSAINDKEALDLFLSLESAKKWNIGVLEARLDPQDQQTMYLPSVEGQTLETVYTNGLVEDSELAKLFSSYAGFQRDLEKELSSLENYTYYPYSGRPSTRSGAYGQFIFGDLKARLFRGKHDLNQIMALPEKDWPPSIVIWLHPRNVLVSSRTLQLVIIDPN